MMDHFLNELSVHFLVVCMLVACASVPVLHTVFIRVTKAYGESFKPLIMSYTISFLGWCLGFIYAWQANFFDLNLALTTPILTSLFIYFGFVIGYFEFFFLINRGYALSIMMDISRRDCPPNVIELEREYAGGKGLRWMLTKRLNGLLALGLVTERNGELRLRKHWPECLALFLSKAKVLFSIQGSG